MKGKEDDDIKKSSVITGLGVDLMSGAANFLFPNIPKILIWIVFILGAILTIYGMFPKFKIFFGKLFAYRKIKITNSIYGNDDQKSFNDIAKELSAILITKHPNFTSDKIIVELLKSEIRKGGDSGEKWCYAIDAYVVNEKIDIKRFGGYLYSQNPTGDFFEKTAKKLSGAHLSQMLRTHELNDKGLKKSEFISWLENDGKYLLG